MSDSLVAAAVILGILIGYGVLSRLRRRSHPREPRGVHFGAAAAQWAEPRFSPELRPMAAFVAELLCEQLGVGFAQLEPQTDIVRDLGADDFEPVAIVLALEEDLGINIPEEDGERIVTISDLVHYLHHRLRASDQVA